MEITVRRATERRRGTFWRPVEHTVQQRETIEILRHKATDPGSKDKVMQRRVDIELGTLDLLLAGARREYTDARVEDPYKQGRFIDGFVYVRALAAFVYKTEVEKVEGMGERIGPGAIISKAVRIEPGASIGAYAELETGVRVREGASIGPNSVVRKGTLVNEGAALGAHSYVGQFSHVKSGANIGPMSTLDRGVRVASGAEIKTQVAVGQNGYIGGNAWLDDSVHVGRQSYIGTDTIIGEMTTIGDHSHVGDGSSVGAESRLGDFVRVARGIMLVSPTYAVDGAFISESNFQLTRPEDQA